MSDSSVEKSTSFTKLPQKFDVFLVGKRIFLHIIQNESTTLKVTVVSMVVAVIITRNYIYDTQ